MCGIAGFLSARAGDVASVAQAMGQRIRHRGPDADGLFSDPAAGVALVHKRLSIIDLSERGRQPMWNETRDVCVMVNGEIYNYVALREELSALGHRFGSLSDSEVVLHGFEQWGTDILPRLRGMYAIALYEVNSRRLVLARDPMGIKPLYIWEKAGSLAFASEAKAFAALPPELWSFGLDRDSLDLMLRFQYLPDSRKTLLQGIRKLPAGHVVERRGDGTVTERAFWRLEVQPEVAEMDFEKACECGEALLTQSVKWTLNADVPVGVLLSGGLDSSLVAALASRSGGQAVHTYTATFDHVLNEGDAAEVVARHLKTEHHPVFIDAGEVNRRIDEIIPFFDDLTSFDGGLFTLYLLAEKIRERGIKVLLFGDGADELFAGYSWFGLCQYPWRLLPRRARSLLMYYGMTRMLPGWAHARHANVVDERIRESGQADICRQVGWYETTVQLPNHFNMKTDKAMSAQSLEGRVPFLDHKLAEFAFSLPAPYKMKGAWFSMAEATEKHLLRSIAAKYLPASTATRKKRGFLVPVAEIIKANLDKVHDRLEAPDSLAREYFSPRQIENMLAFKSVLYSPIEKQKEFLIWKFFLLESWRRTWRQREAP